MLEGIMLMYALLIFCLATFDISAQEIVLNKQQKAYCAHVAEQIEDAPLTFQQGSLLLNMLYNMYLYTKYESIFKKHTFALYTQFITLHDTHQPEETAAITKLQGMFSQAEFAANQQMHYYRIWQVLEKHIREDDPELANLIDQVQDIGQKLVQDYVQNTIKPIDRSIVHAKKTLESGARSNHTIARFYELLITKPELFSDDKDLSNIQKINVLHGQNKSIQKNIDELLNIKQEFSSYIQALQEVVTALFYTIYQRLYMHLHTQYPDQQIEMLKVSYDQIEESDQVLPYPIVPISNH